MTEESSTRAGSCALCEAMCGLTFTVRGDDVTSTRGDRDDPLSRGHVCPKALAVADLHNDGDRLRRPVRRIDGGWVEVEWDEAYRIVTDALVRTRERYGPDAVGLYWGNPMAHSLGALTHGIGGFVPMLKTRNRFSATSLDSLPHFLTHRLLYGHQLLAPIPDIDRTDFMLIVGANPLVSNGSMMSVPDVRKRIAALQARGGHLVVVDPRRTETADAADRHHFVRPGTDALMLLALLHTVLTDGPVRAAPYVDSIADVTAMVADFTPDAVAPFVGMSADDIRCLAHDFAAADSAVAYGRMGVSTQRHGTLCQWALHVLNILTGNLDRVGGALFTDPAANMIRTKVMNRGEFGRWHSRVRGLPEFDGELPSATLTDEIRTPGGGQIKSLVVLAGNPVLSSPGGSRLADTLPGLDFMVAVDLYINETTRHADVILPPSSSLTRDQYDLFHHHFAVRNTSRFTPAVLPVKPGEKQDWEIYRDLALRYRRRLAGTWLRRLVNPRTWGEQIRLRLTPVSSLDILLRTSGRGLSVRALRASPHGIDLGPLTPSLPDALHTPDKRIDLMHTVITKDVGSLREEMAASAAPADGELLLIGRRHLRSNNSWLHNSPRLVKGPERHHLLVHPNDLADRGIAPGDTVTVESGAGVVTIEVQASDNIMRGVVSIPHGYGHRRDGVRLSVAGAQRGPSANDLTEASVTESITSTAVFNGVPVRIALAET
ncbi:MAG: molybdopterin-dependent oxidoreductase [Rhodococcus sp. (in: high G+C Gram-positive bacteria)]